MNMVLNWILKRDLGFQRCLWVVVEGDSGIFWFLAFPQYLFLPLTFILDFATVLPSAIPPGSSYEVSVQGSDQHSKVVSHVSYCFSWILPVGQARGIPPTLCIIYSLFMGDGFTVSWWKGSGPPSYLSLGTHTLEKRHIFKIILSLCLA